MQPSYTIIIPVYERLFGFKEALQSAMDVQGCTEILVLDNCSSHNEFELICKQQTDNRVRYERHPKNLGIYGSINRGTRLATGDFFSFLGSDDTIEPDIYRRFINAYTEKPDLDIFFGPFNMLYLDSNHLQVTRIYPTGPVSSKRFLEDAVDQRIRFPVLYIARREKFLQFPFVEHPHSANDWLWIYSNASRLNFYADEKIHGYWRIHGAQDFITMKETKYDAWPSIYFRIAEQLKVMKSAKVQKAYRRGESVILNLLINEKKREGYWRSRLTGEASTHDIFVAEARKIAEKNWLLNGLLYSKKMWPFYYNSARAFRKLKFYQDIFS